MNRHIYTYIHTCIHIYRFTITRLYTHIYTHLQAYFNIDSIMFKCIQVLQTQIKIHPNMCYVHPNVSNMSRHIQMHQPFQIYMYIYAKIHKRIPILSCISNIPNLRNTFQTYQRKSKHAEIHPDTNTPPSVPKLYLNITRRQINIAGAAEIQTEILIHAK